MIMPDCFYNKMVSFENFIKRILKRKNVQELKDSKDKDEKKESKELDEDEDQEPKKDK